MTYTKEINRSLYMSEDDKGVVMIVQADQCNMSANPADIVVLNEDEAVEVYRFLHRKFCW